jgi:hypothetical protein
MEVSARLKSSGAQRPEEESPVAFDDPVPADSGIFRDLAPCFAHSVERQVQRKLLAQPNLSFSSLVVRRMPDGICLEGIITSTDGSDVCSLAKQVEGVNRVLNHLLVQGTEPKPAKAPRDR